MMMKFKNDVLNTLMLKNLRDYYPEALKKLSSYKQWDLFGKNPNYLRIGRERINGRMYTVMKFLPSIESCQMNIYTFLKK